MPKYAVSYNTNRSVYEVSVDDFDAIDKNNHYEVIDFLERQGLSEANGDFYYDPVKHTFRFSEAYDLYANLID